VPVATFPFGLFPSFLSVWQGLIPSQGNYRETRIPVWHNLLILESQGKFYPKSFSTILTENSMGNLKETESSYTTIYFKKSIPEF
jgi:hypothetical protein